MTLPLSLTAPGGKMFPAPVCFFMTKDDLNSVRPSSDERLAWQDQRSPAA